jgi:hypothetical protein
MMLCRWIVKTVLGGRLVVVVVVLIRMGHIRTNETGRGDEGDEGERERGLGTLL